MTEKDRQLFRGLMNPYIATAMLPFVRHAFKVVNAKTPDNYNLWVDIYQRPNGTVYYRVSFYVGAPPTGRLLTQGEEIAAVLTNNTEYDWEAYVARRVTRPTMSIKVVAKCDIDLNVWPISRLAHLPRW